MGLTTRMGEPSSAVTSALEAAVPSWSATRDGQRVARRTPQQVAEEHHEDDGQHDGEDGRHAVAPRLQQVLGGQIPGRSHDDHLRDSAAPSLIGTASRARTSRRRRSRRRSPDRRRVAPAIAVRLPPRMTWPHADQEPAVGCQAADDVEPAAQVGGPDEVAPQQAEQDHNAARERARLRRRPREAQQQERQAGGDDRAHHGRARSRARCRPSGCRRAARPATSSTVDWRSTISSTERNLPPRMTVRDVGVVNMRCERAGGVLVQDAPGAVGGGDEHEEDHHAGEHLGR